MNPDRQDDKTGITPIFKIMPRKNELKSKEAGRDIYDDEEVVEVRWAGSNQTAFFPATAFWTWEVDPESGEQVKVTYAERWPRQYQQFKRREIQTKSGTPIDYAPFLTEGKKAEMKALAIYTVEALAALDGQELKNIGQGGRELKNQAQAWIEKSSSEAIVIKQRDEIEALKAKLQVAEDNKKYAKRAKSKSHVGEDEGEDEHETPKPPRDDPDRRKPDPGDETDEESEESEIPDDDDDVAASSVLTQDEEDDDDFVPDDCTEFNSMPDPELKRFIQAKTGKKPLGNPGHKALVQMASMVSKQ